MGTKRSPEVRAEWRRILKARKAEAKAKADAEARAAQARRVREDGPNPPDPWSEPPVAK